MNVRDTGVECMSRPALIIATAATLVLSLSFSLSAFVCPLFPQYLPADSDLFNAVLNKDASSVAGRDAAAKHNVLEPVKSSRKKDKG